MHNFKLFLTLTFIVLMVGCSRIEPPFAGKHALQVHGHKGDLELKTIVSHPDGGFVVGANTRKDGKQKIWVMKYNQSMQLEWERLVEVIRDLRLEHILINNQDDIFLSGFSFGSDQDSLQTASVRTKGWNPYFHLLDKNGHTQWEKYIVETLIIDEGNDALESINDVIQNREGDYLICGQFERDLISLESGRILRLNGLWPTLLRIPYDGGKYLLHQSFSLGRMESIAELDTSIVVFNEFQPFKEIGLALPDLPKMGTIFQISKDVSSQNSGLHEVRYTSRADATWPWSNISKPLEVGFLKQLSPSFYTNTYVFSDHAYRYRYNLSNKTFDGEMVSTGSKDLVLARSTFDGNILLVDGAGNIRETNQSFETINRFKIGWPATEITKLQNGQYVLGVNNGKVITLLKYNQQGILTDE